MADAQYYWPSREKSNVIGKPHDRLDGMIKSTGKAKYTYDIKLDKMLYARALGCPHAHCKIKAIDVNAAKKVPGVVHVYILPQSTAGSEINWQGELIAIVSAESEAAAAEGVAALKVDYELLDVFVDAENLQAAQQLENRTAKAGGKTVTQREPGDDEDEDEFIDKEFARLFKEADHVVEGYYGIDAITHCCLEPHGSTVHWDGDKLIAYLSTQNVSKTDDGYARNLEITADKVDVHCQYIGGGFGSKFKPDYWGTAAARIAKETGRPVKFMLSREQELKIAGNRPSGYIKVKLGADKEGRVTVWDSHHWGSAGAPGRGVSQGFIPYVFTPPNYRRVATGIKINAIQSAAWRAPNHPQACAMTHTALDDLAAKMGANSLDVFMRNCGRDDVEVAGAKAALYRAQMMRAAELMDWNAKWHAHGKGAVKGSVVEGLGMALHTWQGTANDSTALLKIYPDGSVESFCGTQDLGTGTRTVIAQVLAETFGLTVNDIKLNIGISTYPNSGASGGSTTVGGVSESHRRAGQDAAREIFKLAANKLNAKSDNLEAVGGRVQVVGKPNQSISWKEACKLLGLKPLEITASYARGTPSNLSSLIVGGVQMAHVAVDKETGIVKMRKFVAVQDQGLVINPKTCKSQIYGAVIMCIAGALFEQRILDPNSGAFVNAELSDYRLARLGDVGEIVIDLFEPDDQRKRGVIGNGEPPVISGVAAISNAIANALGTRVPVAPYTPDRVAEAIRKAAGRA